MILYLIATDPYTTTYKIKKLLYRFILIFKLVNN